MSTKKPAAQMRCNHCEGKGSVPLTPELAETLAVFSPGVRLLASDVQKSIPSIATNAIANRLSRLQKAGLLEAHAEGRTKRYSLPKKPKKPKK